MTRPSLRSAPHPLRELLLLLIVTVVATFMLTIFTQGMALRFATVSLGLSAFIYGITVLTNLNGAADYYSRMSTERKWLGVDYSGSLFGRRPFIRVAGLLFAIVGVVFTIGGASGSL